MSLTSNSWVLLCGWLLYLSLQLGYRLFFHPLRKFPGPKRAVASFWYRTYHDVFRNGQYIWVIEQMHERYGPVVRITPDELHIRDPYFYDEIYAGSGRKRDKTQEFVNAASFTGATFATVHHDHHRFRRSLISNMFSKQSVQRRENIVQENVFLMGMRLEEARQSSAVVQLQSLSGALSADIITHYAYGDSHGYLKGHHTGGADALEAIYRATTFYHTAVAFPLLESMVQKLPLPILRLLPVNVVPIFQFRQWAGEKVAEAVRHKKERTDGHRTIFETLVDDDIPVAERDPLRLQNEAAAILGAGSDPTSRAMAVTLFYLINNRDQLLKLREELRPLMIRKGGMPSWVELEKLPYLTGVIYEGLRLSYGPSLRLSRVAPDETLHYNGFDIPPGTPLSQSNYFVHMDSSVFPNPTKFDPDRWVEAAANGQPLKRFLVSFAKGSRNCLGINLAYCQLFLATAMVCTQFDMELHNTSVEDITLGRDLGLPQPVHGRFHVDVKVTGTVET